MDNLTQSLVLDAAADYIEQHGWHQGDYTPVHKINNAIAFGEPREAVDETPPACLLGAYYMAKCALLDEEPVISGAEVGKIQDLMHITMPISVHNDTVLRTKEEAVKALRRAAKLARMGNIGDNPREYEFEPMPETVPVVEPAAPTPQPEKVPA